jgi:hypothetical protein
VPGRKPTKGELAQMRASHEMGESATAIGEKLKRSHNTVLAYLRATAIYNDPEISALVEKIKEREAEDLTILGLKARRRLHQIMDEGKAPLIPTVALMDRAFQQVQLIKGKPTQIYNLSKIIEGAQESGDDALRKMTITITNPTGPVAVAVMPESGKKETPAIEVSPEKTKKGASVRGNEGKL